MLQARGLTKRYGGLLALDRVSFDLNPGEIVGYLGPNGSGKSTTVNLVVGLLEPTAGSLSLSRIEFVDDLPKTLTGKIRRIELRRRELQSDV